MKLLSRLLTLCAFVGFTISLQARQLPELKPILDAQAGNSVINIPQGQYLLNNLTNGAYQFTNLNNVAIHRSWHSGSIIVRI